MSTWVYMVVGLLPYFLPYVLVASVPRWWQAFIVVVALAGLTIHIQLDWQAFERANPNHGGKFGGFEVFILAMVTALAAFGLLGRFLVQALARRGGHWSMRLAAHVAVCVMLPCLLLAVRFVRD